MYVLAKSWNVNCTAFQKFCWTVIEKFLDKETVKKLSFHREPNPTDIINNFHPSQLEKRFGGEAQTPTVFWPPIIPSTEFGEYPEYQLPESEYEELIKTNPGLKKRPDLIQDNSTVHKIELVDITCDMEYTDE